MPILFFSDLDDEMTELSVQVPPTDFATVEQLISLMQAADQALSIDDCINDIFTAGLTATTHRLIPMETADHD